MIRITEDLENIIAPDEDEDIDVDSYVSGEEDQEISSADTSINSGKVPELFHLVKSWKSGSVNLDYGGGKYDTATAYLETLGVENLIYDPFNRPREHNREVINTVKSSRGADTVSCSNVLNVIAEKPARYMAIKNCHNLLKRNGTAYFTVYVGKGDGIGRLTSKGYQLNKVTGDYISEIEEVFSQVVRKGRLIIARR